MSQRIAFYLLWLFHMLLHHTLLDHACCEPMRETVMAIGVVFSWLKRGGCSKNSPACHLTVFTLKKKKFCRKEMHSCHWPRQLGEGPTGVGGTALLVWSLARHCPGCSESLKWRLAGHWLMGHWNGNWRVLRQVGHETGNWLVIKMVTSRALLCGSLNWWQAGCWSAG